MTIADKLLYMSDTKQSIRDALTVVRGDPGAVFRDYSTEILRAAPTLLLDFVNDRYIIPSSDPLAGNAVDFSRPSEKSGYYTPDGVLGTASNNEWLREFHPVSPFAPRGRSVWEARTNLVTRNSNDGAVLGVVGSGGSLPTGWNSSGDSGVDVEVVGIGSESGLPYVDVRFHGTAVSNYRTVGFGSVSGYANNTTYAQSVYMRLIDGVLPPRTQNLHIRYNKVGGGATDFTRNIRPDLDAASLVEARHANTGTTGGDASGTGTVFMQVNWEPAQAVDFTLRIGLPQLEQGATASPPIPTSGSAVTRSADVVSITGEDFSPWFNGPQGAFAVEFVVPSHDACVLCLSDGTTDNLMELVVESGSVKWRIVTDGVEQALIEGGAVTPGDVCIAAPAYAEDDFALSVNGDAAVTAASGEVPVVDRMYIGTRNGVSAWLNNLIRRIVYYPKRLSNAQLQALSGGSL